MRKLVTLLLSCFLLLLGSSCKKAADNSETATLVVGMDLSYPPFESINTHGEPSGISVEIARALGEFLHRPVRIESIPFTGLIPSLLTGKIDLIISSMTDTKEREKTISFSDPYLKIGLAVLAGKKSVLSGGGNLDESGRTIAVRQGTTAQVWAMEHLKVAKVLVLDKESSAVLEVIQGKADGFLYDQMSVWKNHQEHPNETAALLDPVQSESWSIGLRPSDTVLLGQVNRFLKSFRSTGGFDRLGESYLKDQKEAFTKAGIPFYF
ncbi:MAG: transporter substrate-binding domain-containing protein [Verrucomicrobiota bacterium]